MYKKPLILFYEPFKQVLLAHFLTPMKMWPPLLPLLYSETGLYFNPLTHLTLHTENSRLWCSNTMPKSSSTQGPFPPW